MIRFSAYLILFFSVLPIGRSQGTTVTPDASPMGTLAAIQRQYQDALAAYQQAEEDASAPTPKPTPNLSPWQEFDKKQADLFMSAVKLAEANPKSDVGFAALEWTLQIARAYYLPAGAPALELLAQQYADNPKIGTLVAYLAYYLPSSRYPSRVPAVELLKAVLSKNPDRTARGQAALGLAWLKEHELLESSETSLGEHDSLSIQAIDVLKSFVRDYGDCPNLRTAGALPATNTLGEEAEVDLFRLQHLQIGQLAPEIEGEDLDGVRFKLSDYRSRVVLLVFWASWCGPCMAAVPHEEELVSHFDGRPFVLIGINGDGSKIDAARAVEKQKVPWRSFWNGISGSGGPIAKAWSVRSWPTVYVLDEKGVIQANTWVGDSKLKDQLERLVKTAEAH